MHHGFIGRGCRMKRREKATLVPSNLRSRRGPGRNESVLRRVFERDIRFGIAQDTAEHCQALREKPL